MLNVNTIILKNGNKKLKINKISNKTFQVAITEDEFFINPCLEKVIEEQREINYLEYEKNKEINIQLSNNTFIKVNKDFNKIKFINSHKQKENQTFEVIDNIKGEVLLDISDIKCFSKEINGERCKGNQFKVRKESKEKFYGLGQHQTNILNYNYNKVKVFHDYKARGGEVIGIPFLISSKGYGLINNTLAQSEVDFTGENEYIWNTDWCKDFSIFIIFGSYKNIYKELAKLIGKTPMPLKSSLGYIQCKQRYESEEEIRQVARKYREKRYPIDMIVVDWFYWKILGDMSMDPEYWPNPKEMNDWLKSINIDTMISVWPRFMKGSKYYDELEEKGWFMKDREGNTVYGTEDDKRGALIDTTNEDCGRWYWNTIYENLGQLGFNAWWTDENEPDLWPYDYIFHAGKGYEIFNLYPFTHVKHIYEGHREKYDTRCCILSRSAYLGSQRFGTQFWSSDIYPTWGVLEKQIPAAINFCASGLGYWSSDIGGWQALPDYKGRSKFGVNELLIETQGPSTGAVTSKDYPELYIRWFQFSVFCPILRAHGTRDENEIWSYGEKAEEILAKQLELRYSLMPYIYSMAYKLHSKGIPILRGLFLEFPEDEEALNIKNQFMFGDSILVAPVVKPGQKNKKIYLPKGTGWYDFYNHSYYLGGCYIDVEITLERIPIFIRENSILPMGNPVESTKEKQDNLILHIFGDNPKSFILYEDDGRTYKYESGKFNLYKIEYYKGKIIIYNNKTGEKINQKVPFQINVKKY